MYKKEYENFIFRYRGQIPVIALCLFLCISFLFEMPIAPNNVLSVRITAIILIGIGFLYRCFTVGFAALHTSGRNRNMQVAHDLNTLGAYSIAQHPLYFANSILWVSIGLISNQWGLFFGGICLSWFVYRPLIRRETQFLSQTFGTKYKEWIKHTPLFWPNPFLFKKPNTPFDWWRLFATEYPTWISILTGILTSLLFSNAIQEDALEWRGAYSVLVLTSILIVILGRFFKYVVVRKWLKKSI